MNLILLDSDDFLGDAHVRLAGRRLKHVRRVLGAKAGDTLRVGRLGGKLGRGRIERVDDDELELSVTLDEPPPAPLDLALVVALPRPPMLRRVLHQATSLGVKRIWLIHARRVEKSYWQSAELRPESIREQLLLGLEQAVDTILPEVELRDRFRPFVEDELPTLANGAPLLLADAEGGPLSETKAAATLVIGPEGGFIPFEIDLLEQQGAERVSLGARVLRVDTAVVAFVARMSSARG